MTAIHVAEFPKDTVLFSKGEQALAMYFVLSGKIEIRTDTQQMFVSTGAVIGDLAFLNEWPHTYGARCETDVRALQLDGKTILDVFERQPRIGYYVMKEVAAKAAGMINETKAALKEEGASETEVTIPVSLNHLLPEDHPVFTDRAPETHDNFLFTKDVDCPVCKTSFQGTRIRVSRLMVQEHKPDFRTIYSDFDPLWYYVWVCPNCLFAYPARQYSKISRNMVHRAKRELERNPIADSFKFDERRTLHQVFLSYYLALRTYKITEATPQQWGNIWLRLVWLYEDNECTELIKYAAEQALKYFDEAMSTTWRSEAGDQKLYVIMGELCLRLDRNEEAFRYFRNAATIQHGDERYRRTAVDRIQDLRSKD